MNRAEKIQKLANAIREYRGSYSPRLGKWIRPPKPAAWRRIDLWLDRLLIPTPAAREAIDGFKSLGEMREWLKRVEEGLDSNRELTRMDANLQNPEMRDGEKTP